jgi:hypothetical protein
VPGRVVSIDRDNGGVDVLTAVGVIRLNEVTLGGVEQRASDVVRSVHDTLGLTVTDVLAALQDAGRIP